MANDRLKYETFSRKPLFGRRQYWWRLVHQNGSVISRSSEGYNNAVERDNSLWLAMSTDETTPVVEAK